MPLSLFCSMQIRMWGSMLTTNEDPDPDLAFKLKLVTFYNFLFLVFQFISEYSIEKKNINKRMLHD
jgi:hypothetical protein